jgi:ketosteroid isomerase-like protein
MFLSALCLAAIVLIAFACAGGSAKREQAKAEIIEAEKQFSALCQKEGIEKSFVAFAHKDAKILRGDIVLRGIEEIRQNYRKPFYKSATLVWAPDFADASESGELGYTYGHYTFTAPDSTGKPVERKGIFHSVWRKENGEWKFVWDN